MRQHIYSFRLGQFIDVLSKSPSQDPFSHSELSYFSPSHGNPDPDGSGALHDRVLDLVPGPQLDEQSVQEPHSDHPPSISLSEAPTSG